MRHSDSITSKGSGFPASKPQWNCEGKHADTPNSSPPEKSKKILIVDDHPMTRAGLVSLINSQSNLCACWEASEPAQALEQIGAITPDLILTDLTMPGRGGTEFIKDILAFFPKMHILVVSMHDETIYAERVLRAGARGYIMKDAGGAKMLEAIRRVLAGEIYVSTPMASTLLHNIAGRRSQGSHSPIEILSDREFEVFQLIGQGKGTREIAIQLHLSPKTVDTHRAHIKEKLEMADGSCLIRYAVRWFETQEPAQPATIGNNLSENQDVHQLRTL